MMDRQYIILRIVLWHMEINIVEVEGRKYIDVR